MRFYKYENNNEENENDLDEEMEDGEFESYVTEFIGTNNFDKIIEDNLNRDLKLLKMSVRFAKSSFFWRFKSLKRKLQEIKDIYKEFETILNKEDLNLNDEEKEEENDI